MNNSSLPMIFLLLAVAGLVFGIGVVAISRRKARAVPQMRRVTPVVTAVAAEVVAVDGSRVELLAGGKKLRQPLSALRQFQPRRYVSQQKVTPKIRDRVERKAFLPRLVLVGKRVEDASLMLDRFLDDALLHGELNLEIVHGSGQGILRRAVREFLAGRKEVAIFQAAAAEKGGDNVTIVELRH